MNLDNIMAQIMFSWSSVPVYVQGAIGGMIVMVIFMELFNLIGMLASSLSRFGK